MKPFDTISIAGYDVVASAQVLEGGGPYGEAVVLNNNSTVFIVAMRLAEGTTASVRNVIVYDSTELGAMNAYRAALKDMVALALTH